jgi:hypothetical protein
MRHSEEPKATKNLRVSLLIEIKEEIREVEAPISAAQTTTERLRVENVLTFARKASFNKIRRLLSGPSQHVSLCQKRNQKENFRLAGPLPALHNPYRGGRL